MSEQFKTDLRLFDEGAPSSAESGNSGNEQVAPAAGEAHTDPAAGDQAETLKEDPEAEFEALIKGKYKKQFGDRASKIVERRLKESQKTQQEYSALLDKLYMRYGVTDAESLSKAMDSDKAYIEEQAVAAGMSAEQFVRARKLELENEKFRQAQQAQQEKAHRDQVFAEWMRQGENVKKIFPAFDFETEIADDNFTGLLSKGLDVLTAYKVCHFDEIQTGTIQAAVADTQKRVTEDIMARGKRPVENAAGAQAAVSGKVDIRNSTKAQRDEWERRILKGENPF